MALLVFIRGKIYENKLATEFLAGFLTLEQP
jgi:hypothetical protein